MSNRFDLKDLQSAYYGLLCEAKIDDLLEKSDLSLGQQELIRSTNNQLSNKTKYINFMIKNINNFDVQDLIYIDKYQQAFPGLDIDRTTVDEIHNLIKNHQHKKEMEKVHPEAEKIFEDDDVLIVSPLTYEAAVYHGKGTNWCISTSNSRHWDRYTDNFEKFYFLISKKYPITDRFSKIAVQILRNGSIGEFRDREDEIIQEYEDIPVYDFIKYERYLKPMEVSIDIIIKTMWLKYNESTGLYDCDYSVIIKDDSLLLKDGKLIIKFGYVEGSFNCSGCTSLTSLEGCPEKVGRDFTCGLCSGLTSLEGCPKEVGGSFNCSGCISLTSLEGCPKKVGRDFLSFNCTSLTSLKGCPEKINGHFYCHSCTSLTSLEGAPKEIGRDFYCFGCTSLDSLEGCPKEVQGDFCFHHNKVKLTNDDVKKLCDVWGAIDV